MDSYSLSSYVSSSQHSSQLVFSELVEVNGLPDESFPVIVNNFINFVYIEVFNKWNFQVYYFCGINVCLQSIFYL